MGDTPCCVAAACVCDDVLSPYGWFATARSTIGVLMTRVLGPLLELVYSISSVFQALSPADEVWMRSVAMEMNLSETAFVVRREDGDFDLR